MSKDYKIFEITLSRKFSNGLLAAFKFGHGVEESDVDEEELAALVYNATMRDIKNAAKKSQTVTAVLESLKDTLKNEKKIKAAEAKFMED